MRLDLDALRQIGQGMQEEYQVDGDLSNQLDKGLHVYSIQFEPRTGRVSVHIQWPSFRNLVANEADHPATITKVEASTSWLHCTCFSHGVEIHACLTKHEVVDMLKALVAEHPEGDYEVCEGDDILALFTIWQHMIGWDLDWPGQKGVQSGG